MLTKYKFISIIVIIFLVSINQKIKAQSFKGKWLLEGNLGNINLSNQKYPNSSPNVNNTYKSNTFSGSFSQKVGYFVSNSFVIGIVLDYSTLYQKSGTSASTNLGYSQSSIKMGRLGLSPFVRYYFSGKASKNKFYIQMEGRYSRDLFNTITSTTYNRNGSVDQTQKQTNTVTIYSGAALVGFNHFFNDNIAFNTNVGYSYGKTNQNSTNEYWSTNFVNGVLTSSQSVISHSLLWNFGFTFILGGKHKEETK